jgi:hypothetical protein
MFEHPSASPSDDDLSSSPTKAVLPFKTIDRVRELAALAPRDGIVVDHSLLRRYLNDDEFCTAFQRDQLEVDGASLHITPVRELGKSQYEFLSQVSGEGVVLPLRYHSALTETGFAEASLIDQMFIEYRSKQTLRPSGTLTPDKPHRLAEYYVHLPPPDEVRFDLHPAERRVRKRYGLLYCGVGEIIYRSFVWLVLLEQLAGPDDLLDAIRSNPLLPEATWLDYIEGKGYQDEFEKHWISHGRSPDLAKSASSTHDKSRGLWIRNRSVLRRAVNAIRNGLSDGYQSPLLFDRPGVLKAALHYAEHVTSSPRHKALLHKAAASLPDSFTWSGREAGKTKEIVPQRILDDAVNELENAIRAQFHLQSPLIGLIRLHNETRHPIMPYFFWIALDRTPKAHLCLPVWRSPRFAVEVAAYNLKTPDLPTVQTTPVIATCLIGLRPLKELDWTVGGAESEKERKEKRTATRLRLLTDFYMSAAAPVVDSVFYGGLVSSFNSTLQEHALRSALAAIMSRNMSHNLASHVLASLAGHSRSASADRVIFRYVQQRMDYIAQISTELPRWTVPIWFYGDLLKRFYMQHHLLNNIAKADGLTAYYWDLHKSRGAGELLIAVAKIHRPRRSSLRCTSDLSDATFEYVIDPEATATIDHDFTLAIPGGIVGLHAFYTILENVIRNSAKHGWSAVRSGNLRVTIAYEMDLNVGTAHFVVFDDVSQDKTHNLTAKINEALKRSFVDRKLQLVKENLGIGEIRVSAGYLNMQSHGEIGNEGDKKLYAHPGGEGFIRAVPVTYKGTTWLGYSFPVPLPKNVLFIGNQWFKQLTEDSESRLAAEVAGFHFWSGADWPERRDYEVAVCDTEWLLAGRPAPEELFKRIDALPARLLLVGREDPRLHSYGMATFAYLSDEEFNAITRDADGDWRRLHLLLHTAWLQKFRDSRSSARSRGVLNAPIELFVDLGSEGTPAVDEMRQLELRRLMFKDYLQPLLFSICNTTLSEFLSRAEISDEELTVLIASITHPAAAMDQVPSEAMVLEQVIKELRHRAPFLGEDALPEKLFRSAFSAAVKSARTMLDRLLYEYEERIPTMPRALRSTTTPVKTEVPLIELPRPDHDRPQIVVKPARRKEEAHVIYARHHSVFKNYQGVAFYQESLSGSQFAHSTLAQTLSSEDEIIRQFTTLQLVENALLRVMVVDERIAEKTVNNRTLANRLMYSGVDVPLAILNTAEMERHLLDMATLPPDLREAVTDIVQPANRAGVYFVMFTQGRKPALVHSSDLTRERVDAVIIHQGVLDKLFNDKARAQEFATDLRSHVPLLYITSGRGQTPSVVNAGRFIPFASIDSYIGKDTPEKLLLTRTLLRVHRDHA